jgi:hypothetical protein
MEHGTLSETHSCCQTCRDLTLRPCSITVRPILLFVECVLMILGMGNRFAEMDGYASLIRGHGIVAAIVFLFIVPAAIIINRFYRRNPWMALRIHIWLHILTLLLTTVVFVLGYMAVGPARALTNPHHGIGLAIYLMVIVQFFGGWWIHSREKRKRALVIPLKVVVGS